MDSEHPKSPLIPLPPWAEQKLLQTQCIYCAAPLGRRDVTAVGLRRSEARLGAAFYFEVECPQCGQSFQVAMLGNANDATAVATALLLAAQTVTTEDQRIDADAERRWQELEWRASLVALRLMRTHDEFMRAIGLTTSQIQRYGTFRRRQKKSEQGDA